jgi:excisionase family DNA binding protein
MRAMVAEGPQRAERLVSVGQAAERLGLSIWTLRNWAYAGKIASCKLGARLLIRNLKLTE